MTYDSATGNGDGPLAGLLVADFSRVLAGPYATMLLGDLGATVVKVERPGAGDDTRQWGPPYSNGLSTYFQAVNRNKTSVVLDLRRPEDRDLALALCGAADVVIENFRPGTMERLGLGYEHVRAVNPGAVYCSITGFGRGGGAGLPGYDLLIQAVGGLMSITGGEDDEPTKVGVALVDVITGLHALTGILAALRLRDGAAGAARRGQRVEVDLMSSLLSALTNQTSAFLNAGVVPRAMGNAHPSIAPYESLRARDRPLVVAVGNDTQFQALCAALSVPFLPQQPEFATNPARVAHRGELVSALETALATDDAATWVKRLRQAGVPCGLINRIDEAVGFAEQLGLHPTVEIPQDVDSAGDRGAPRGVAPVSRQIRHPVAFSRSPATYRQPPPRLPAGTAKARDTLAQLGVLPGQATG